MNLSLILQIISLVLTLPGIIALFCLPGYQAFAVLAILVGLAFFIWWQLLNYPLWTVIEMLRMIEIKVADGSFATATKNARMRANHKGLTEYVHRRIRSDGDINNFQLHSKPVPLHDIQRRAGEYMVWERFPPMRIWQSRNSTLSYDLLNSFPTTHEFSGYIPDYHTKKVKIEVHFPLQRPARNARAYSGSGAETQELNPPELSSDGCVIIWERKNLKPGSYYRVEWDW